MKWPFIRRSKYELLKDDSNFMSEALRVKTEYISKLEDQIEIYRKLHDEYAQLNHDNLHEINRLNQELANEMNSHRETKTLWHKAQKHNDAFLNQIKLTEKELEETKEQKNELSNEYDIINNELYHIKEEIKKLMQDIYNIGNDLAKEMNSHKETKQHEQKLFEAHDKLNQQNMGLLFENEKLSKQNNQLILDKNHLKSKIKRLDSLLTKHKLELESAKSNVTWFYGNYARFKDMIEKSGYYKRV